MGLVTFILLVVLSWFVLGMMSAIAIISVEMYCNDQTELTSTDKEGFWILTMVGYLSVIFLIIFLAAKVWERLHISEFFKNFEKIPEVIIGSVIKRKKKNERKN